MFFFHIHSFIRSQQSYCNVNHFFPLPYITKKKNHIWINAVQINPIQTLLNCLAYCTIDGDDKIRKHRCWVIQMVWMFFFFSFRIKRIALPCLREHQNRYNMWCTQTTPECCGTQHYLKLTVFVILILLVMLRKMVYDTSKYIENTTSWKDMWLSDAARIWCDCPFRVRFFFILGNNWYEISSSFVHWRETKSKIGVFCYVFLFYFLLFTILSAANIHFKFQSFWDGIKFSCFLYYYYNIFVGFFSFFPFVVRGCEWQHKWGEMIRFSIEMLLSIYYVQYIGRQHFIGVFDYAKVFESRELAD